MPFYAIAGVYTAIGGAGVYLFDWFTDDLTETTERIAFDASQAAVVGLIIVGAYVVLKED